MKSCQENPAWLSSHQARDKLGCSADVLFAAKPVSLKYNTWLKRRKAVDVVYLIWFPYFISLIPYSLNCDVLP